MTTAEFEYIFAHLGFLIRGYLMRLGLTQGLWQEFKTAVAQSIANNSWFTERHIKQAMDAISNDMLAPRKLTAWLAQYHFNNKYPRNIGIIMAGNLPLVGFYDLLCVLCSGYTAVVKLSHKDPFLLPMLKRQMVKINYRIADRIIFTDHLDAANIDAVIATGSDNTEAVFTEKYGHLPHIFRHSRTSVGILCGNETAEQMQGLAHDMLDYFGLGCRSVTKLFVPKDYDFVALQQVLSEYSVDNQNFMDAYRYARAVSIAKGDVIIDCGCCILQESKDLNPLVAQMFFEYYLDENDLSKKIPQHQNRLQCLVGGQSIESGNTSIATTNFGTTQCPQLTDYADGVDVMKWLYDVVS
jgi:hypothetical protein